MTELCDLSRLLTKSKARRLKKSVDCKNVLSMKKKPSKSGNDNQ